MGFNIGGWFQDRAKEVGYRINQAGNAVSKGVSNVMGAVTGEPDHDKVQDAIIHKNNIDAKTSQKRLKEQNTSQDIQIQKIQGNIKEFANQLGLDPNHVSVQSIANRVQEVKNDAFLTKLSDEAKNAVRGSTALNSKQRKVLEVELNKLEKAWKEQYQKDGSKFNLDDPNALNIISKLTAVKDFMGQLEKQKEKNPNYDPFVSGIAQTLRDTTNRINSGRRAELPTDEKTLVSV